MSRFARIVAPGYPHHVTQRGNRRQPVFFRGEDYSYYLRLMSEWCHRYSVKLWAYCLMPNHVHLVAVPGNPEGFSKAIGEAHRRYSLHINRREGWSGHLWQDRFSSSPMDERYLLAAVRYIELNPVHSGIVARPEDYQWSSARGHLGLCEDHNIDSSFLTGVIPDWREFLTAETDPALNSQLALHISTGRPMGGEEFCAAVASATGIPADKIIKHRPGPKAKNPVKNDSEGSNDILL